jgi:hypothetical protein
MSKPTPATARAKPMTTDPLRLDDGIPVLRLVHSAHERRSTEPVPFQAVAPSATAPRAKAPRRPMPPPPPQPRQSLAALAVAATFMAAIVGIIVIIGLARSA